MANNCAFYDYIVLSADVFSREIVIYKCCIKSSPNEYITRISFNEWLKLDPYQVCLNNINNFGKNHNPSLNDFCIEKGAEGGCYRENNQLKRICLYLDFTCNANCVFCKSYKKSREKLMSDADSRKEIKSIYFDTLNKLKQKNVEVELTCVGEPFFYLNDITLFLESLQENDFNRISIVTNGSLINDKVLKTLETCKVPFFFLVSLNVPNEQAYNEIMKLSNFQKTFDNILAIHNLGIIINVTFTICRESLKYLNDYLNVFSILKQNNIAIEIRKDYNAVFTNEEDMQIHQLQEWAK